jgi:hypothetical protein
VFVRAARTERAANTAKGIRRVPLPVIRAVLAVFATLAPLAACARIEPPPGGPPDPRPPMLVGTTPDSFARLSGFSGSAEFHFNEVVSEGGSPNRGEGTGGLEQLVILSPSEEVPKVRWHRNRITVRPQEGWKPNRVYRVELLPGVSDLRNNRSDTGAVITFSTGAPRPQTTLQGQVIDWSTARPAATALVIASLLPDSLPYRAIADSSGRFSLGPLPQGDYLVRGVVDQDNDHRLDLREAFGVARATRAQTNLGELWAFVHDTTPPRIQTVEVGDSVKAVITFTQKLDPRQRLAARDVTLRLLPDSTPIAVSSILPQPLDDSLHGQRPVEDSAAVGDSVARPDSARGRGRALPRQRARPAVEGPKPSRPPLNDRMVLRVPRAWSPGSRMAVEIRGVRNVSGVAGTAVGVLAVPAAVKPDSANPVKATPRGAKVRAKADTVARPPGATPAKPYTPPKK